MLTESDRAGDLLYQLGAMTSLTSRTSGLLKQAKQDENVAASLSDQAGAAEKALADRKAAASAALERANSLASTAAAAVATQEKNQDQLIEQVAFLKGTTAAVQKKYYAGKAAGTIADASPAGSATGSSKGSGSGSAGRAQWGRARAAVDRRGRAPDRSGSVQVRCLGLVFRLGFVVGQHRREHHADEEARAGAEQTGARARPHRHRHRHRRPSPRRRRRPERPRPSRRRWHSPRPSSARRTCGAAPAPTSGTAPA